MRTKKLRRTLLLIVVIAVTFLISFGQLTNKNDLTVSAATIEDTASQTETTDEDIVFSYLDIFEEYYENAQEYDASFSERYSFQEFVDSYYSNDLPIDEYTTTVLYGISTYGSSSGGSSSGGGSSSEDAYYILKESQNPDKTSTPTSDFARQPVYSTFDYSIIQEGDIVYETSTVFFDIGHNALVYDMDKSSGYGSYIQTIEAVSGGVQYGYLDDSRMIDFGVKILRVSGATSSKIETAKAFSLSQLGKSYNIVHVPVHTSASATSWYCSELVFASYLKAGINISASGEGTPITCTPSDIYESPNTYEIADSRFLTLSVSSKKSSTWYIEITNPSDHGRTVYYNSKMCFNDDAQNWTDLKNIKSVYIAAGENVTVEISENWFATSITASFIYNEYRLITYADNLSTSTGLTYAYSLIKV